MSFLYNFFAIFPKSYSPDFRWTGIPTNESGFCTNEESDPNFDSEMCIENKTKGYVMLYYCKN